MSDPSILRFCGGAHDGHLMAMRSPLPEFVIFKQDDPEATYLRSTFKAAAGDGIVYVAASAFEESKPSGPPPEAASG